MPSLNPIVCCPDPTDCVVATLVVDPESACCCRAVSSRGVAVDRDAASDAGYRLAIRYGGNVGPYLGGASPKGVASLAFAAGFNAAIAHVTGGRRLAEQSLSSSIRETQVAGRIGRRLFR